MIYISTSCLNSKNLFKILKEYRRMGIDNIELGSNLSFTPNLVKRLKSFTCNYIIHNYFPPPENSFTFNMASINVFARLESMNLARNAIRICNEIGSHLYSFHTGFKIDPKIPFTNPNQTKEKPHKEAYKIFMKNISALNDYAQYYDIMLAVENLEIRKGMDRFYLLNTWQGLRYFVKRIGIGILLDLGHLNITSRTLNFDKYKYIEKIHKYVSAIHVHDNDSLTDTHDGITKDSWVLDVIKDFDVPIVLESHLTPNGIIKNKSLLERVCE